MESKGIVMILILIDLSDHFYGYSTNIPWEFQGAPSRSLSILYLVYGPLFWLNKFIGFNSLALLYIARLQLILSYICIAEWSSRFLTSSKQEGTKSIFFIFSSYITWVYQSHTFSNSLETQLLLISLSIIQILRLQSKLKNPSKSNVTVSLLAIITSIGIFNRITFIFFLIGPSIFLLKHFWKFKSSAISFLVFFTITSFTLIYYDTKISESTEWVITPWNNFIYNKDPENLAQHGLHPYYTHLLINLPQLIGPLIIPLFFKNRFMKSTPFLSIVSGLSLLSIIPHQELRFLIPLVPLVCMCIDFKTMMRPSRVELAMKIWVVFNLVFGLIMGSLHQRGVLVTLDHLRETEFHGVQIWWKTYKPPSYILQNPNLTISEIENIHNTTEDHLIDLMGEDVSKLTHVLAQFNETLLITSSSSIGYIERLNKTFNIQKIWDYKYHLDLDHFDFNDKRTFNLGIEVYNITQLI
ncbi:GPI mannosyltransferase 4 [Wickerhamomyces ciferrii]|uniref:Mannosyltransferase n=1 Tax=Wickerhamomyces ciferrii (strain ATCC 14091 / BCRC 22168 / CBS 111 / JCM 3599 / NBRC 0793 / NRRL Y-1031 F-60-10) TaxID=1206466 RepID=K0KKZ6_WICCF|nr:GPI mannosyltransferase 4 [Wickerhamomyces ciferrii]CCH43681.1 GPI mannosyltransferase 4 [Wickerhamomyces ciferrii]